MECLMRDICSHAKLPNVRTTSYGVETIGYLGNELWQLLPLEVKISASP